MYIAIVEDDEAFVGMLEQKILSELEWETAEIDSYRAPYVFQNALMEGRWYDFCILDMKLPKRDGLQLAAWIRKSGLQMPVVFITSFSEYAINGYQVQAFDYLIKSQMDKKWSGMADRLKKHYSFVSLPFHLIPEAGCGQSPRVLINMGFLDISGE